MERIRDFSMKTIPTLRLTRVRHGGDSLCLPPGEPLPFRFIRANRRRDGGAMLIAIFTVGILSLILGGVLRNVSNRYSTGFQVASWQEALFMAEAGADVAMAELRTQVQGTNTPWLTTYVHDGTTDRWKVGTLISGSGASAVYNYTTDATSGNAGTFPKQLSTALTTHAGEGNRTQRFTVTVDTPSSLKDSGGRQWLRVRSTGGADLPGPPRVSTNKMDNILRRLSMVWDNSTGAKSTTPRVNRTIECIAKPATMFGFSLLSQVQIKNDGAGLVLDSYDSGDSTKSTNGVYDSTKRQKNGDIGSNAFPIKHDKTYDLNLNNDYIFGEVGNNYSKVKGLDPAYFNGTSPHPTSNTNPLIKTDGNSNPTGAITTSFYNDLPRIKDPTWSSAISVGSIDNKEADRAVSSDPANPTRIVADKIALNADNTWLLKTTGTATKGYVEIWVKGDITLNDGGQVAFAPGVKGTIYFDRNITIDDSKKKNSGFDVQSDLPADLLLLGVEQPNSGKIDDKSDTDVYTPYKASGNIKIKNADFCGAIYAPDHNIKIDLNGLAKRLHLNYGWSKRLQGGVDLYGSFIGRTINAKGPVNVHYDEQLNDVGPFVDYGYVSWFETVNLDHR